MKRIKLFSNIIVATLLAASSFPLAVTAQGKPVHSFSLPTNAKKVTDNVYDLGEKTDPASGNLVHGYALITPRSNNQKPSGTGGKPSGTQCFSYLASGLKWKTNEPWVIDAANNQGIDEAAVFNRLVGDLQTWENASSYNIFGNGSQGVGLSVEQSGQPDGNNEIMFGSIAEPDVIAVTITWGYYSGPPKTREIVEWDQIYDQADFGWSLTGEAGKMDFDNIATHEVGHAAGMGHTSLDASCEPETMYPYAGFGETNKRDLGPGDIAGISGLY